MSTRLQSHVPEVDGGMREGWALLIGIRARYDSHTTTVVGQGHDRNLSVLQALIAWLIHLVFGRQVHPELNHFKGTSRPREVQAMLFFMDKAGTCGHPLHITRTDGSTATCGIAMIDF